MKKCFLFLFLILGSLSVRSQDLPEGVAADMTNYAACGNISELQPLFKRYGSQLPSASRLFCEVVLARANHNDALLLHSIDSLQNSYSRSLDHATRYELSMLKSEAMIRRSDYAALADFCSKEMKRYRNKKKYKTYYEGLKVYLNKGLRLSDSVSVRGRLLRYADRGDVFAIEPLYRTSASQLDTYARLMSRFTIQRGSLPHLSTLNTIDSLLNVCADSLDADGVEQCLKTAFRTLFNLGQWKQLSTYARQMEQQYPQYADYAHIYAQVADGFSSFEPVRVERPSHTCMLQTSLDWPLMTHVGINGRNLSNIIIDTGYPVTMISRSEADSCHLKVLPDTLRVPSMFGILTVYPAVASKICLGEINLYNVPIYVADNSNVSLSGDFVGLLGTSALERLGVVDFCPERLEFPYQEAPVKCERNLKFSDDGGFRLKANHDGKDYLFALDTGAPSSTLSAVVFPYEQTDTLHFSLRVDDQTIELPYVGLSEQKALDHVGIVGFPLLRSFERVRMDFNAMCFSGINPQKFKYRNITDWINEGNLFRVERNLPSLSVVSDETGEQAARIFVNYGKNNPQVVLSEINELFLKSSESRESPTFNMVKLQALVELGRYADAVQTIDHILDHGYYPTTMETSLAMQRKLYVALSTMPAEKVRLLSDLVELKFEINNKTHNRMLSASVNDRETDDVRLCLTQMETTLSAKLAKKLKVRILQPNYLFEGKNVAVGIINRIKLGGAIMENVLCYVLPDKTAPITLGNGILRHFTALSLNKNFVRFFANSPSHTNSTLPLRLDNGQLYLPANVGMEEQILRLTSDTVNQLSVANQGAITIGTALFEPINFKFNPNASDSFSTGTLSLSSLMRKQTTLTFDFRKMVLQ